MFRSLSAHVTGNSHGKECHPLAGEPAQVTDDRNNANEQQMKYLQNPTRVVVMCAIGAIAVAASVQQASAQGPPRPVATVLGAEVTHLGVPLADHVMLVLSGSVTPSACGGSLGLRRLSSDGSVEESEFVVPAGRSLVVLDVDAVVAALDLTRFPVGTSVGASLMTPSNIKTGVFMAHTTNGVLITVPGMNAVSVSSALAAGVAFGPGQQVCMRAEVRGFGGGFSPNGRIQNGVVRGYLR